MLYRRHQPGRQARLAIPNVSEIFTRTSAPTSRHSPSLALRKSDSAGVVMMCHLVQQMCIACMSYGGEQFCPCRSWSSADGRCVLEYTTSGLPDVSTDLEPTDKHTLPALPTGVFFGVLCQACHGLFRARILHPLAAQWEVLGKVFVLS
jgi:hypothetical protein